MTETAQSPTARSPWSIDRDQWAELLSDEPAYRLNQLWDGLYRQRIPPSELTTLPKGLRQRLSEVVNPSLHRETARVSDDGETIKTLWRTGDNAAVETVLMHYPKRSTVCISSQAGCGMACGFCATGQIGLQRNLSVGEILEQVVAAATMAEAVDRRLSNVVFMGMGEPLANYDRVLTALHRLIGDMDMAARKITVSTVGLAPQMHRLAGEGLQVGLALSLHAANDRLRSELVPVNRRYPIAELIEACQDFRSSTGRRVSLEWAMMDGVNDHDRDSDELASVASAARAHVNLIPLNPTPGWPTTGSPPERIERFANRLRAAGINATVRANRGTDIEAACGQLAADRDPRPQPVRLAPSPASRV